MARRVCEGCCTNSPSSQQFSKVGNDYCLCFTGGKSKVQCLICPKLCRIPAARRELRSLLALVSVSQEDKVLLRVNVLYCVWGRQGSCKARVLIKGGEKPCLGLTSLPVLEQGSVFLNRQTKQKICSSNFVLLFWSGLNCFYVYFFNYSYSDYDYNSFILLNLIFFIYETCMNQRCDSRRLLLSCADVDFIL